MAGKDHSLEVAERFIKAMQQIIVEGLVRDNNEFADRVGVFSQNLSKIRALERYPPLYAIVNLCIEFEVNPAWILLGQGEMFTVQKMMNLQLLKRVAALEKKMAEMMAEK